MASKIDSVTVKVINTSYKENFSEKMCSICLTDYKKGDKLKGHDSHLFHKSCIEKWLNSKHSDCPLCKALLVKKVTREEINDEREMAARTRDIFFNAQQYFFQMSLVAMPFPVYFPVEYIYPQNIFRGSNN